MQFIGVKNPKIILQKYKMRLFLNPGTIRDKERFTNIPPNDVNSSKVVERYLYNLIEFSVYNQFPFHKTKVSNLCVFDFKKVFDTKTPFMNKLLDY